MKIVNMNGALDRWIRTERRMALENCMTWCVLTIARTMTPPMEKWFLPHWDVAGQEQQKSVKIWYAATSLLVEENAAALALETLVEAGRVERGKGAASMVNTTADAATMSAQAAMTMPAGCPTISGSLERRNLAVWWIVQMLQVLMSR